MKMLVFSLLALGAVGCQSPQDSRPAAQATKSVKAKLMPKMVETALPPPPPVPVRFQKVLRTNVHSQPVNDTQQVRTFFRAHNLALLIRTVAGKPDDHALNGFRGPDQYRTEVVVLTAQRSSADLAEYAVTGLTRTRKRVTHFSGHIRFDLLTQEPLLTADDQEDIKNWSMVTIVRPARDEPARRFAVAGTVELQELGAAPAAAHFSGRLIMEMALTKAGRLRLDAPFIHGPSLGGAQRYVGTWTVNQTGQATPSIFVEDTSGDALFAQEEFLLGERDVEINPAYAKKGWNTLWENDEWWAASPRPKLNL